MASLLFVGGLKVENRLREGIRGFPTLTWEASNKGLSVAQLNPMENLSLDGRGVPPYAAFMIVRGGGGIPSENTRSVGGNGWRNTGWS